MKFLFFKMEFVLELNNPIIEKEETLSKLDPAVDLFCKNLEYCRNKLLKVVKEEEVENLQKIIKKDVAVFLYHNKIDSLPKDVQAFINDL